MLAIAGLVSYFCLQADLPLAIVILAGLSAGALVGFCNGVIIAFLKFPPIIVTLAMLSIVRGTALILGGPEQHLIRNEPAYSFIGSGNLFGLPFSIYIFALVGAVMIFIQRRTPLPEQGFDVGQVLANGDGSRNCFRQWYRPDTGTRHSTSEEVASFPAVRWLARPLDAAGYR
ncbi:MAG: hypothetical protein WDZ83_18460 [Rhizobiaceae bacterium]